MTDLLQEYRIVTGEAGWRLDRQRGRLAFEGPDATAFLHALLTADVASVGPGGGVYAAYLTPQGRLISDLALYRRAHGWLADVPSGLASVLASRLDAVIFTEDVRVQDVSESVAQLSVVGPDAAAVVARAVGADVGALTGLGVRATVDTGGVLIARTDLAPVPTFDVFLPPMRASDLAARLENDGVPAVGDETFETLRIEAGRPAFGVDMDGDTIPLEAGIFDRAISATKGCYVGQEVIMRVLHRGGGRVARRLVRLEAAHAPDPIAVGSVIVADRREVGQVTSAAWSPARGRGVALGYMRREAADTVKSVVLLSATGEVPASVLGLAG